MRKKAAAVVMFVVMIFSIFVLCLSLYDLVIEKRDWVITCAVTTFIEIPGGDVLGSYTDNRGVFHENVSIYDPIFSGHSVDFKVYEKGKKVWIIYDPNKEIVEYEPVCNRSENFFYVIMRIAIPAICFMVSSILLIEHKKRIRQAIRQQ